jgi:MFS family permease
MAAGMMIGAQTGARLSARFTPKYVVFTGLMWAAFILYLFSGIDLTWTFTHFAILLALFALGLGLTFAPITNASISTVPLHEVGVASSILALVRNIAGAFGVAIFATILTNSVTAGIMNVQKFSVINSFDPNVLKQAAYLMIIKANLVSFHIVFLSSAAITFVGALSALLLRETTKEMGGKAEVSGEGMM